MSQNLTAGEREVREGRMRPEDISPFPKGSPMSHATRSTETAPMPLADFLAQLDERKSLEHHIRLNPGVALGVVKTLKAQNDALLALVREMVEANDGILEVFGAVPGLKPTIAAQNNARALLAQIDGGSAR